MFLSLLMVRDTFLWNLNYFLNYYGLMTDLVYNILLLNK